MKRILAIVFLAVFLFNVIGYYAVYLGLKTHSNHALRKKLDAGMYESSETLALKVPITLPYQADWQSFQRVDGDFELHGEFYELVQQKVERDTLTIVYIKDHRESSLFESFSQLVQASTDTPISKKAGKLIENFTKDFLSTESELCRKDAGWCMETAFGSMALNFISPNLSIFAPPPKSLA